VRRCSRCLLILSSDKNKFIALRFIKITPNKKGITWHVFDVVKGNKIVKKNKISTIKPTEYQD
jgi:hypothetical protein